MTPLPEPTWTTQPPALTGVARVLELLATLRRIELLDKMVRAKRILGGTP